MIFIVENNANHYKQLKSLCFCVPPFFEYRTFDIQPHAGTTHNLYKSALRTLSFPIHPQLKRQISQFLTEKSCYTAFLQAFQAKIVEMKGSNPLSLLPK